MEKLRKVQYNIKDLVKGKLRTKGLEGYFHTWEQYKDDEKTCMYALVEDNKGNIVRVHPEEIIFLNNPIKEKKKIRGIKQY